MESLDSMVWCVRYDFGSSSGIWLVSADRLSSLAVSRKTWLVMVIKFYRGYDDFPKSATDVQLPPMPNHEVIPIETAVKIETHSYDSISDL